jgi:hypothetical protein
LLTRRSVVGAAVAISGLEIRPRVVNGARTPLDPPKLRRSAPISKSGIRRHDLTRRRVAPVPRRVVSRAAQPATEPRKNRFFAAAILGRASVGGRSSSRPDDGRPFVVTMYRLHSPKAINQTLVSMAASMESTEAALRNGALRVPMRSDPSARHENERGRTPFRNASGCSPRSRAMHRWLVRPQRQPKTA